jgi:hypothetical protein
MFKLSRQLQRGGGVAIVFNSDLKVEQISNEIQFTHFEKLECMVSSENKTMRLCVIYLPPPSRTNNFRNSVIRWMVRFSGSSCRYSRWTYYNWRLIFCLDDTKDGDARKLIQSLEDHGLIQHVTGPTHKHGHTLDVLITRENSSILLGQPITHDPNIFDQKGII